MEFKIDDVAKVKIQKNKYQRQEWSKTRLLDMFLYVLAIYVALFSIFIVINRPTFSLFYGSNGAITTSGRVLTIAFLAIISYCVMYIPYFSLHTYLIMKTGKDIVTRKQEKFKIEDDKLIYSYHKLFDKAHTYQVVTKIEDIEKISYIETIKKIIIVGKSTIETYDKDMNNLIRDEVIDNYNIYSYFKPNILKELEKRDIQIEINFFA